MGTSARQVVRWKEWVLREIEEGRFAVQGITKEQLFEFYAAWLDAERGVHEVDVPPFYVARCPVTNAQFAPFVAKETGGYDDPSFWTEAGWAWRQGEGEGWNRPPERRSEPMYWRDHRLNGPNQPVVGVTWFEAFAYAHWLTAQLQVAGCQLRVWKDGQIELLDVEAATLRVRLPTEAEWEVAARGRDGRIWPWGNQWDASNANTSEDSGEWMTTPVGVYPEGASPYGALDTAGNVWEWTSTRWGSDWRTPDYGAPYRADDGREDSEGTVLRVVRGGSWGESRVAARCAFRNGYNPVDWGND
jgi:formylglycine-generating enzyme required for sulfatase activity